MVELRKISILDNNIHECIALEVAENQRDFVAHNAVSLGQAYALNKHGGCATPYAIYADGVMVGFIMYEFMLKENEDTYGEDCYYFWRFMIDERYQGKGYGKAALTQIIDEIRTMPNGVVPHCYVSIETENVVAQKLYEGYGFVKTGQMVHDEAVMKLVL